MPEAFVGCGSNIEPARHLAWALDALEQRFGPLRRSGVYQSAAFGFDGPDFLNLVVSFETEASAATVEAVLSELENARGRGRDDRSGSRTLDLDLLLYGERVDPALRLPRIDILRYPFVLVPLAELAPQRRHPLTGMEFAALRDTAGAAQEAAGLKLIDALDAA